jgi:type IV pilus assembly protein PilA
MLNRLRERAGSESGFTLIELLVVMLILGILAAIAIPAFLNQKSKANDTQMKVQARSMQTAIETYSTDHNGQYTPTPTVANLQTIEPTIPAGGSVASTATTYTVVSPPSSGTNNRFAITRTATGTITRDCGTGPVTNVGATGHGTGGCASTATNGSFW